MIMERGLLWLPLLAVFIGLAWAGWQEYQKVEAYRLWAQSFQQAKYDIYAVLGQQGTDLTWGKPTPKGPVNVSTFSLTQVQSIRLLVNQQPVDAQSLPSGGNVELEFILTPAASVRIPFTEVALAAEWYQRLQQELQAL